MSGGRTHKLSLPEDPNRVSHNMDVPGRHPDRDPFLLSVGSILRPPTHHPSSQILFDSHIDISECVHE